MFSSKECDWRYTVKKIYKKRTELLNQFFTVPYWTRANLGELRDGKNTSPADKFKVFSEVFNDEWIRSCSSRYVRSCCLSRQGG